MCKWSRVGNGYERSLGDSEYAFFPASQHGLGDMFLRIALRAPKEVFREERVKIGWSIIRQRHPLLMCKVLVDGNDLNTARFSLLPFSTQRDALAEAGAALRFTNESKDELIFNYMNGPRLLSNDRLSYIVISSPVSSSATDAPDHIDYNLLICATHFIGDGAALNQSTHELLCILTSTQSDEELERELDKQHDWENILPPAFETRLRMPSSAIGKAAAKVNFWQTLGKEIGGHAFSRTHRGLQRTVLVEHAFSEEQTAVILAHCKANNVTVNHALSALCNVAWGRCTSQSTQLPMMMYNAINLRPHLTGSVSTYWYLALTYFNVVLPSFVPSSHAVFWHRARLVKSQTHRAVYSPFMVSRALQMASSRALRARGLPQPPAPVEAIVPPAPSVALLGLSPIGNLDRTFTRASYPSAVQLHSVTAASRLKPGGMLLVQYTFGNKLWLQLCWDEMGFEAAHMERFWEALKTSVEEFLC